MGENEQSSLALTTTSKSLTLTERRRANRNAEPPGFAEWYDLFPRKEGRFSACQAYKKALKVASPETIMSGLASYRFNAEREFQPLPETWLNKRRWECDTRSPIIHPNCVARKPVGKLDGVAEYFRNRYDEDPIG